LPATILLTAEVDPFRDVAESFARRLMAAEIEVSASRNLGTIHDFAWLPDLLHARGTIDAHCIIANAIRERLAP
jgi:acetyl esterase/lipase